ncbi:MAG: transcription termination factor NusA, partial [Oscillibacter sp.]|nr:transcription termination factor NusA [Oscillibacter sp.]
LTGTVVRMDPRTNGAVLRIGTGQEAAEALLVPTEQIPGEDIHEDMKVKVYVADVRRTTRGPQIVISRSHPGLVRRLFELEVPEIYDGTVEIRSVAREAGSRTKMAVWSNDADVDPIGACVGPRGQRVANVVEELRGEKIDIIKFSDNPAEYVAAALAPAEVKEVFVSPEGNACQALVPDDQLSLAIGREGQNARLAARLTGYKIDIKPESYRETEEYQTEAAERAARAAQAAEDAEESVSDAAAAEDSENADAAEAAEAGENADAVEAVEDAENTDAVEPAETMETAKTVETAEVAENTDAAAESGENL